MNKKVLPKAMQPAGAEKPAPAVEPLPEMPHQQAAATQAEGAGEERRPRAVKVVEYFSTYSGVAGLIPLPFVDLAAIAGLQFQMLRRLSRIYEIPFSDNRGKAVVAAAAGTMIPASSGIGAGSLTKGMPVVGAAVSIFVVPTLAAGATYAIGMAFIRHFEGGGTLLDFNPPDYREFLKVESAKRRSRGKNAASQTV